jgi:2-keto-4-pentenoate hydratase/2-oxohepta-3-ene-1,7-dioic acid hydratase in catechol pathway
MHLAQFYYRQRPAWGVVSEEGVRLISGSPYEDWNMTDELLSLDSLRLLPPCNPSKIVCVGLNYRDHARELGQGVPEEPILFLKPPTAAIGHRQRIIYPAASRQVDYEAELAVVIRSQMKDAGEDEARAGILGYTCGNDVTARDLQKKDVQWTRAKSFDTFCPLGPWLATGLDPGRLCIKLILNGETRQDSSTSEMIFPVARLVSFVTSVMTLFPGDVIMTGTPAGVGAMQPGDTVTVEIEKIGILTNELSLPE